VLFIDAAHCCPLNGHLGIDKTQAKLKQFAYWRGWTSDAMLQVKRCSVCNQYRHGPRQKQGQLQQASGCVPMQKVHVDLVGPNPTSSQGHRHLLTVICSFTQYLVTVPIREKTSLNVARALVKNVYLPLGIPKLSCHDGGSEFWNSVMKDLAKLLGIHPTKTTSHRPSANGMIERVHSTLHAMFAKLISSSQRDWHELP